MKSSLLSAHEKCCSDFFRLPGFWWVTREIWLLESGFPSRNASFLPGCFQDFSVFCFQQFNWDVPTCGLLWIYLRFEVHWACWTCRFLTFIKFGKFSDNFFSALCFFFFPSGSLMTWISDVFVIVPHVLEVCLFFFLNLFCLCPDYIISIDLSSCSDLPPSSLFY